MGFDAHRYEVTKTVSIEELQTWKKLKCIPIWPSIDAEDGALASRQWTRVGTPSGTRCLQCRALA